MEYIKNTLAEILFNRFFDKYIEGITKDNFDIHLFEAVFNLHGLKMKKEALDEFHLPIGVKEGVIGHLQVELPITTLATIVGCSSPLHAYPPPPCHSIAFVYWAS